MKMENNLVNKISDKLDEIGITLIDSEVSMSDIWIKVKPKAKYGIIYESEVKCILKNEIQEAIGKRCHLLSCYIDIEK